MSDLTPNPTAVFESPVEVCLHEGQSLRDRYDKTAAYVAAGGTVPLSRHPRWLAVLEEGLGHRPFLLEVVRAGQTRGILPLALVRSVLFGPFLVSLPYLSHGGIIADDEDTTRALLDRSVELAERLDVRHLELRHERPVEHPALTHRMSEKVHMRLKLPPTAGALWNGLPAKVRNQVRKAQKLELTVAWGGRELLSEFHDVFSHNMRDLGTPTYGRELFDAVLHHFDGRAELCVVRAQGRAASAGLLAHGWGVSEVLSASTIRKYNQTNANMLLYWSMLTRSVDRGQDLVDFGRSTRDSSHYRFKKQWGAEPGQAEWQYHVRWGDPTALRPGYGKYSLMIHAWKHLPLSVSRWIGPRVVRGIP
jgi:FemAB-related protein (PEP-CTERM system-associated)